jgi:hypothetical protein
MGMSSMLKELQKQRRSCQAKYLEAEAAALKHLQVCVPLVSPREDYY